jgi:pyruvate,water dikinase
VVEHRAGRREVVITAVEGGGVREDGPGKGSVATLSSADLGALAALGTRVAAHFGRPQDIEWTHAGGRLQLVQARPLTALPPPPIHLGPAGRRIGSILLEYLPVRPYPIDMSTWLPHGPAGMMSTIAGRIGIRGVFTDFLHEQDGVVDRLVPGAPRPAPALLLLPFRLARWARNHDPARWREDPRFTAFLAEAADLEALDLAALPWPALLRLPRRALAAIDPITDLRTDYLPRTGLVLLRLLLVLVVLGRRDLLGELIRGARTRTTDANDALEVLAAEVRADPALRAAVEQLDPARLPAGPFADRLAAFLAQYGHRETTTPLLVTPPTWGEPPETYHGHVSVLATRPPSPTTDTALSDLLARRWLPGRARRALGRWVAAARAGIAFREDSHFEFTRPLPVVRRALLEIGRRLADAGVLDDATDVFHLRLEELEDLADASDSPREGTPRAPGEGELRGLVRARSARRDELAGVPLIDPFAIFPRRAQGDALLVGTPAGTGTATGPVAVVRAPAEFMRLHPGDVLVCPYTNPSWTPLFQIAAAVVVDAGGPTSHAAIVAREYGIPAVMGTADGTSVLTDGQRVTVDGLLGRVTAAAG